MNDSKNKNTRKDEKRDWNELINHLPYRLTYEEFAIDVDDGVFTPDPQIILTTEMVRLALPDLRGKRVADVGTGTGVLAIAAARMGAVVVATDVSEPAIVNAVDNVCLNDVQGQVDVRKTNLLDGVPGRFDLILANLPISEELWEKQGFSAESLVSVFLRSAKASLKSDGEILIPWGSFAEEGRQKLEDALLTLDYSFVTYHKEALGYTWYLYRVRPNDCLPRRIRLPTEGCCGRGNPSAFFFCIKKSADGAERNWGTRRTGVLGWRGGGARTRVGQRSCCGSVSTSVITWFSGSFDSHGNGSFVLGCDFCFVQ